MLRQVEVKYVESFFYCEFFICLNVVNRDRFFFSSFKFFVINFVLKDWKLRRLEWRILKKGVFIDFEWYKKDFFNEDIILKFKGNFEGIVENDKEKFKVYFYEGLQKELFFFDEENVQFMFNDLEFLEKISINGCE